MMSRPMKHLFSVAHHRQQGKGGLDPHAVIPGAFEAQFQVVRDTCFTAKAKISQDQTILDQQINQEQEILITVIHGQPVPTYHLSQAIDNPAQFQANRPPTLIAALGANLPARASLSNGKQQFNRKTIDDIQQTRFRQQLVGVMLMPSQLPLQGRSLWQTTEQSIIIPFQPAIEGPKASTLQGEQDADSDHLTGIQLRIPFFRHVSQSVIDTAKNKDDNQFRRHESPSIWLQHLYCPVFS